MDYPTTFQKLTTRAQPMHNPPACNFAILHTASDNNLAG